MKISLLGTISVRFTDNQGEDQVIKIQLPDYILANYISVEGKPRVSLISGSMVLEDQLNNLKSVIFIRGLIKKKSLFQTTYEPNIQTSGKNDKNTEKLIEGIIYKIKKDSQKKKNSSKIENLKGLQDVEFELAEVSGLAIDKPVI